MHASTSSHLRLRRRAARRRCACSSGSPRARCGTSPRIATRCRPRSRRPSRSPRTSRPPTTRSPRPLRPAGTAFGAAVLLGWTLLGGLDALNGCLRDAVLPRWGDSAYQLALLGAFAADQRAARPAVRAATRTFRIEQRFGFNRMTRRSGLADLVKGIAGRRRASACRWPRWCCGSWARPAPGGGCGPGRAWMAFNLLCWCSTRRSSRRCSTSSSRCADETLKARVAGADGSAAASRPRACS